MSRFEEINFHKNVM